jgi:hypothetical protein
MSTVNLAEDKSNFQENGDASSRVLLKDQDTTPKGNEKFAF